MTPGSFGSRNVIFGESSGADPEFLKGLDVNPPGMGVNLLLYQSFPKSTMIKKNFLMRLSVCYVD